MQRTITIPELTPQELSRFWAKVHKGAECWHWTGASHNMGYGTFCVTRDKHQWSFQAHRVAWFLRFGPIPLGLCVLHHCDVPGCINIDHLFLGTRADNNADRDAKNRARYRHLCGEECPASKLTTEQIITIRRMYQRGHMRQHAIASVYGITQSEVSLIVNRHTWKHVS